MTRSLRAKAYPGTKEVDRWLGSIWELAASMKCTAELLPEQGFTHNLGIRHTKGFQYVRFSPARIDTLSHVHRLDLPVLLTAGGDNDVCPADTIQNLFQHLPRTRSFSLFENTGHRYTMEFIPLATAWFKFSA